MIQRINKLLQQAFGIEIIRSGKGGIRHTQPVKKPKYIEFIGASGVGKTKLFQEIHKDKKKNNWISIYDFKKLQSTFIEYENLDTLYQFLADLKMKEIIESSFQPALKLARLSYSNSILVDDALITEHNKTYNIITEEGIMQNFGRILLKIAHEKPRELNVFTQNRAFIFCYASAEQIANQIKIREKQTGILQAQHNKTSKEELIRIIESDLNDKKELIRVLKEIHIPILEIDTQTDVHLNVRAINDFIKGF